MYKLFGGLFLGWGLGANDSANIFGTAVATKTVRYGVAILLTSIFVLLGSVLQGSSGMHTVGKLSNMNMNQAFIAALGAAITVAILTILALPVSTSQSIIGAVVAMGIMTRASGVSVATSFAAMGSKLLKIVICWVATPIGAAVMAYILYKLFAFLVVKRIKNIQLLDRIFKIVVILSGSYGAYSLGANNVANVTGVYLGQIFHIGGFKLVMTADVASLIGGFAIITGALTYSKGVMMKVGRDITQLDTYSVVISIFAQAVTLQIFTAIGVPVSSSQAIVGTVVGIGLVKGIKSVSVRTLVEIAIGWVSTPISAAIVTFLLYFGSMKIGLI